MDIPAPTFDQRDALARQFHETYERLAPSFGYKTRKESAVPWEDVPSANKELMRAVAGEILVAMTPLYPWAVENRVVQGPPLALFADYPSAEQYAGMFIDLRVIPAKPVTKLELKLVPVAPLGMTLTRSAVQEVWDTFVKPSQEDDAPLQSVEMRLLMSCLRSLYASIPGEEAVGQ